MVCRVPDFRTSWCGKNRVAYFAPTDKRWTTATTPAAKTKFLFPLGTDLSFICKRFSDSSGWKILPVGSSLLTGGILPLSYRILLLSAAFLFFARFFSLPGSEKRLGLGRLFRFGARQTGQAVFPPASVCRVHLSNWTGPQQATFLQVTTWFLIATKI